MAVLPIIKIGHPTLRKVAIPVTEFDGSLEQLAENMIDTMRVNEGIGLAAPQVNISRRLFVIDLKLIDETQNARAYVNPEILSRDGMDRHEEGCLSIPGIRAEVERPLRIRVRYQTVEGKQMEEEMEGMQARVFLHEYDHLDGILFIDRLNELQKKLLEPRLKVLEGANLSM